MCTEKDPFADPPKEGKKKITPSQDDAIAFSLNRTDQSKVRRLEEIRIVGEGKLEMWVASEAKEPTPDSKSKSAH